MIICPKCSKPNGDYEKCLYCGAVLPTTDVNDSLADSACLPMQQGATCSKITKRTSNANKIRTIAIVIGIIGIILAVILGFVFEIATVEIGIYSTKTTYSYNWGLCIGLIISTLCFTALLQSMSYIARAIEEK